MTEDKAAKIITNEINSRAKLNQADSYLKKKKEKRNLIKKIKIYSRNQLEIIFKKIVGYKNNVDIILLVQTIMVVPSIPLTPITQYRL